MLPANQALIVIAVLLIFGFANVFFGKDIFRPLLLIYGFAFGAVLAGSAAQAMETEASILSILVVGGIFAGLSFAIYYVGIAMIGAGAGVLLMSMIAGVFGLELHWLIILATVIICGGLAVAFNDYVLMFGTALAGSTLIAQAVYLFFPDTRARFSFTGGLEFVEVSQAALVIGGTLTAVLTILGTYMQWKSHQENHSKY